MTPATKTITRLRDLKVTARDQLMIDPRIIKIEDGHNPRNYDLPANKAHLEELKASIKAQGVLMPLWVRFDAATSAAILVDGECRLRATLELIAEGQEIDAVPTIQVPGANEAERLILAMTANTGKPLSKLESGTAFVRLVRFGWTAEKIAQRMGFSVRFVSEAMELEDAPEEVKIMLSEQAVTPSLALEHLRVNGSAAVETLRAKANEAKASGKTTAKKARVTKVATLHSLCKALFDGMEETVLTSAEYSYAEVDRKKLRRIAEAVGFIGGKAGK